MEPQPKPPSHGFDDMQKALTIVFAIILTSACLGDVRIIPTVEQGHAQAGQEILVTYYVVNDGKKNDKFLPVDQWYPNVRFIDFGDGYTINDVFITDYAPKFTQTIKPGKIIKVERKIKMPIGEGIALIGIFGIETEKCPIVVTKK